MLGIFTKKLKPESAQELLRVLRETLKYVQKSEDADYSEMGVEEISKKLSAAISLLEQKKSPTQFVLKYLFAPTGPLQETSMANNWVDPYMELAEHFDKVIEQWG